MASMHINSSDSSITSTNLDDTQPFDSDTLFKIAIEILRKPPGIRVKSDVNFLVHAFKDISFFMKHHQENGFDALKNLCKLLGHQRFNEKDTVFNIGELGFTFYIILKGAVGVLIPDYKNFGELREIATLYQGQAFGEMALLLEQPRNATIVCKDKCEFATLTKKDYEEILAKTAMKKIQDQIDFFASLPIFKSHTRRNVSTLIPHFEKLLMQKGEVIYKVGEEPNYAYVILNGQVKLQKKIVAEEKFNFEVPDDFYPQKLPNKKVDLVILGEKEMFGEEDICNNVKRSVSAVVSSLKADIYRISRADFEKRILAVEETAIPIIITTKHKQDWRDSHLKEVEDVSNKTRSYFYSPEKPVPTKEKRPKSQEMDSPKDRDDSFLKTTTIGLNTTTLEKPSGLFLTENSFITGFMTQDLPKKERERTPSPKPPKKAKPPVPKLHTLMEEAPPRPKTRQVTMNMGQATKNFKKQMQMHMHKQQRAQHEIKQLFKTNVFEKIEHKNRAHRKNLNMTQPGDGFRGRSAKDPKYISSRPYEPKIKIEDQHFSQLEAKERILSGVIKTTENLEKLFDFAEMLKLNKYKPATAHSSLQPRKGPTYSVSAEPTIVERILQSNEFFREKNRPMTGQPPAEPFVNIHMRNFREKSLFPKNKPKFLTPKSPQKLHFKVSHRDPNFRSAKLEGSPFRRDSSGTGNLDIRALRTSGYSPY